ncbi:hypothetical protein [Variovorax sp. 770b2]|uniref:hypothetical protein n=1 Tax=Variovorax sp. 770b2 TaxID=1566271 RepID=UPI0011603D44|nr:hypothetical protein [Variovorax sp. 770b2]
MSRAHAPQATALNPLRELLRYSRAFQNDGGAAVHYEPRGEHYAEWSIVETEGLEPNAMASDSYYASDQILRVNSSV